MAAAGALLSWPTARATVAAGALLSWSTVMGGAEQREECGAPERRNGRKNQIDLHGNRGLRKK